MSAIPVIDIAPLAGGSPEEAHAVARVLGRACRNVGFFYVSGHGVLPALIAGVFETSAGLRPSTGEKHPDVKEAFNIGLELAPDDPELLARAPCRAARWPSHAGLSRHHA